MKRCDRCENFLRLGIEAYKWLKQADETLREAARLGLEVPEEVPNAIERLYRRWLAPCDEAERLVAEQQDAGYPPENLNDFRRASEEVKRRVRLFDMDKGLDDACRGVAFDAGFWATTE